MGGRQPLGAPGGRWHVVGFLVLLTGAVLSGLLLTEVLLEGWLGRWDVDVEEAFARNRTAGWNDLTALDVGHGRHADRGRRRRRGRRRAAGLAPLAAGRAAGHRAVVEVSVFLTTAAVIDRQRPSVPRLDEAPPTSSYPSGHTAAAVALYIGLALVVAATVRRAWWRALAWVVAGPSPSGSPWAASTGPCTIPPTSPPAY